MAPPRVAACFHGFLRTGASMAWMGRGLRLAGYTDVVLPTFGYHLRSLDENAERAAAALRGLRERHPDATIDIVTHSMGGLLARATLAHEPTPAIHRVVMLSPPNRGAIMAAQVRGWLPVHTLGWDPLRELLPGAQDHRPAPRAEVGVLTGGRGDDVGYNRFLGGDNDLMVRVDEAWLPGAADFHVVPVPHALMPFHGEVVRQVQAFLTEGRFARAPTSG